MIVSRVLLRCVQVSLVLLVTVCYCNEIYMLRRSGVNDVLGP